MRPKRETKLGALAVQRCTQITGISSQKRVAIKLHVAYDDAHSGWMVLGDGEFSLPHNPPVAGSSPACPTFLSEFHQH